MVNVKRKDTMSMISPSMTSSSGTTAFTINSFTQNLASVLSDTRRSKAEIAAFFTRHWGEQFMPRQNIPPAPTIPRIGLDHFRHYLATTARKHRQYLRAKKVLRLGMATQRLQQQASVEPIVSMDELPDIFFSPTFVNRDPTTFESLFLEPKQDEPDKLLSKAEQEKILDFVEYSQQSLQRHESSGSLASMQSQLQLSIPIEASVGRMFRACRRLQQRLEFFDDAISALLNQQLELKNEQFWRTIHSYGILYIDLEEAISRVKTIRQKLIKTKFELCKRSAHILQLHYARLNRQRLMARLHVFIFVILDKHKFFLQEIACLRDAQTTVQMLLNQNDIARAIECIYTAQEVLSNDLGGVTCFRHLDNQLEEMKRMIAKMLLEEFEALIQRDFAWTIDIKAGIMTVREEKQHSLSPIVSALIRCDEHRFLGILREEIIGIVKNMTKQVVKTQLLQFLDKSTAFVNPSTISEHLVKLTDAQWTETLQAVLQSMKIFCSKILNIQTVIIKCIEQAIVSKEDDIPFQPSMRPPSKNGSVSDDFLPGINPKAVLPYSSAFSEPEINNVAERIQSPTIDSTNPILLYSKPKAKSECAWRVSTLSKKKYDAKLESAIQENNELDTNKCKSPGTQHLISMPCHDISQLHIAAPQLICHAIHSCEERIAKLMQSRFKDTVLRNSSPSVFSITCTLITDFVQHCQAISSVEQQMNASKPSPTQMIIQQMMSKFLTKFTESRREELSSTIDSEQWKATNIPLEVQWLVGHFLATGELTSYSEVETTNENETCESTVQSRECIYLDNDEPFTVIRSSCLLIQIMAQYCDLLRFFRAAAMELTMDVVQCLKLFNSRTCQLILGAGARQLVGLKTITVKHLALTSRSLQLILRFIPTMRQLFAKHLPLDRQQLLRHFVQTSRDYTDHINEIESKLLAMMDKELISALEEWKIEGKMPTPSFQQIIMQIGKFYSSYSAVMPPQLTTNILHQIHANFKLFLRQHLQSRCITPHDSVTYGMVGQDFAYYMDNMRAFQDCKFFPDETISDVIQQKK